MYKNKKNEWVRYVISPIADLIALQLAFFCAFLVRFDIYNPYNQGYYLQVCLVLMIINPCVAFFTESYKNILKRGKMIEAVEVVKQVSLVIAFMLLYLYLTKQNLFMSRIFFALLIGFSMAFMWLIRVSEKYIIKKIFEKIKPNDVYRVLILSDSEKAAENLGIIQKAGWTAVGFCISDSDKTGESISEISVVANKESLFEYIKNNIVDGVFIGSYYDDEATKEINKICMSMGVTIHTKLTNMDELGGDIIADNVGDCLVVTRSVKIASSKQLFVKRAFDIFAGIVGLLVTAVCFIFVAPAIYIKDPGPIFFSQTRVGKNGRKFKIYKFRSMYKDAEERKAELMKQNKITDGMMFKMDDDPRIIKGIGNFIRNYSIDELPQFWNVLKGEMSLIGTRPPTVDEYEKYDYHHKIRLAIKPGITGMWQTSGRSNITDFEEVVKLDAYYITNWSIALDLKILLKTFKVVLKKDGAE
ncbi:MAG: sugar transferase [Clostridia bacterium]|nr:sugar transferase [Clostridia bacterium]